MDKQIKKVIDEFTKQSEGFNEYQKMFSSETINQFAIDNIKFNGTEKVLEVAAGTCGLGRVISPLVASITELDATEAMLNIGRNEAEKAGLKNVDFKIGLAEELPFDDNSFDCVASRLAFHHFADINKVFAEMYRVLKKGEKLVILDMEARTEELREVADHFETLRDPSHVRCVSKAEIEKLSKEHKMDITFCQTIQIPVLLPAWLKLTKTPDDTSALIEEAMLEDINGGEPTGMSPYLQVNDIFFNHLWMLTILVK